MVCFCALEIVIGFTGDSLMTVRALVVLRRKCCIQRNAFWMIFLFVWRKKDDDALRAVPVMVMTIGGRWRKAELCGDSGWCGFLPFILPYVLRVCFVVRDISFDLDGSGVDTGYGTLLLSTGL